MTLRLYLDEALTQAISQGDMSNPDQDIFNGTDGDSKDRRLFIANERAVLAGPVAAEDTTLTLSAPAFANTSVVVIGEEQMRVVTGGGTTTISVERGYAGTPASGHAAGVIVFSAFNYSQISVQATDFEGTDEATWIQVASTFADLDTAQPGGRVNLGDKSYEATLSFWRRVTVPAGTPVQNKTDLKLRVSAMESPIL